MALLAPAEPRSRSTVRLLPTWWPIAAITIGFPIWWAIGLSAAAWPLVSAAILLPRMIASPNSVKLPRGFGWWMLFMGWVVLSTTQLTEINRIFSFGYRFSVYFAATIVFVYIYNETEERLPTRRVVSLLAGFWAAVAIAGNLGSLFPRLSFPSLVQIAAPAVANANPLITALVTPEFAQVSTLFSLEIGRPHPFFPFTNGWGSTWGILFPVVMCWFSLRTTTLRSKIIMGSILVASLYSVILSLNRGLWISIAVALTYAAIRFAAQRKIFPIVVGVIAVVALGIAISFTSLGDLAASRSETGHSNEGRSSLYRQSIEIGIERPVLGWGSPQPNAEGKPGDPSVGTHGHLWLVLVSQGIVGLALYCAWWGSLILRTFHRSAVADIWLHAVLIVVTVQMFFYEHTPIQLPLVMMVAALLVRRSRFENDELVARDTLATA